MRADAYVVRYIDMVGRSMSDIKEGANHVTAHSALNTRSGDLHLYKPHYQLTGTGTRRPIIID